MRPTSSAADDFEPQAELAPEGRSHSETPGRFGSEVVAAGGTSGSNSALEDVAGAGLDFDFVGETAWCPLPLSGHLERLSFGLKLDL